MAGALGLTLSGPRSYHGALTDDAWIGEGRSEATAADIRRALALYKTACAVQIVALGLLAVAHRASSEQAIDVDMRLEMRGERIERAFDLRLVAE